MKTVLDIPDEVAAQLRRGGDDAQQIAERIVGLIKLALMVEDVPPATIEQIVRARKAATQALSLSSPVVDASAQEGGIEAITRIDPVTGLRVIESPPDAPIHRMTAQEVLDLTNAVLLEQDLEWAGVPVRH